MSDPFREQIRATAIERLAKATHWRDEYMRLPGDPPEDHWETASERARERCRDYVTHLVDALGDLLPTGMEWGVRYESVDYPPRMSNPSGVSTNTRVLDGGEMHARAAVANRAPIGATDQRVVSRYLHDWIEVSE